MSAETIERRLPNMSASGYESLPEELRGFAETFKIDPLRFRDVPEPLLVASLATSQILLAETIVRRFNDPSLRKLPLADGLRHARLQTRSESIDYASANDQTMTIYEKLNIAENDAASEQYAAMLRELGAKADRLIRVKTQSYELHSTRGDSANIEKLAPFFAIFDIPVTPPTHTMVSSAESAVGELVRDTDKLARKHALIAAVATAATVAVIAAGPAAAAEKPHPTSQSQSSGDTANTMPHRPSKAEREQQIKDQQEKARKYAESIDPGFYIDSPNPPVDPHFEIVPNTEVDPKFYIPVPEVRSKPKATEFSTDTTPTDSASPEAAPTDTPSSDNTVPDTIPVPQNTDITTPDVTAVVEQSDAPKGQSETVHVNVFGKHEIKVDPNVPVAPNTSPLDVQGGFKEAQKIVGNMHPAFKTGIERIPAVVKSGNLSVMSHGTGDVYAALDPSNSKKHLKLVLNNEDRTKVSALYDQMQLVMASPDNELLFSALKQHYESTDGKLPAEMQKVIDSVMNQEFVKGSDFNDDQKRYILLISYDINTITNDSAEAQVKDAQDAYNQAQAAAQKAAESGKVTQETVNAALHQVLVDRVTLSRKQHNYVGHYTPTQIVDMIFKYTKGTHIAPELLASVLQHESGFREGVASNDGFDSIGIAQFIKSTFDGQMKQMGIENGDRADADLSIHAAVHYLEGLYKQAQNRIDQGIYVGDPIKFALASYNWGSNSVLAYAKQNNGKLPTQNDIGDQYIRSGQVRTVPKTTVKYIDQITTRAKGFKVKANATAEKIHASRTNKEVHVGSKFHDNERITLPGASKAMKRAMSMVKLTKKAMQTHNVSAFKELCPRDDPQHRCSNLCDHVAAAVWGAEHSGHYNARLHRKAMAKQGRLHNGSDMYEIPIGAFMFWGTKGDGHAAIYAGNGMIISTSILDHVYGFDGGVYLAKATDVTKRWGLKYTGWAYDPALDKLDHVSSNAVA